ncbi:4Fe-4S ferredoxin, iron-sulfur binding domain protein [Methanoregula boonei 6A8]|uniref:4Fe-4S ferredoxin, iron-sulfur binding domain protein n=1 Tax=Methanoregula boonei (strain DSM 21154 / JCM 14090 / 6A8) TaxID=456442 RepID=A7I5F9_METB6|nr:4Fe-4S ferredoxin [Methanoregula boonei]ABS54970.1 4Fe-4S ferredoxin, iron-sulfur binding domain protein [Methanoregula boonei 6A8]
MEIRPSITVGNEVCIDQYLCHRSSHCHTKHQCMDLCLMGVFVLVKGDGVYPERSQLCCMCFLCHEFCPVQAITVRWTLRA